ncbi:hypothetical protein [Xylanimonas sp. McL0601]|uniref:hypothetical protein n=1 Tax=Xylanimonas sp. McL0601 TaxID=3414739 RepID=UPI003CFAB42D
MNGRALDDAVPIRLWVGVTGHRTVADEPGLRAAVRAVVAACRQTLRAQGVTEVRLGVVSALAEGADRVVSRTILEEPGAVLEVTLPMPVDDYRSDFVTGESRTEFDELLARAAIVRGAEPLHDRETAYLVAGQRVVERCDVLVAVWDGRAARGPGGTANVVGIARQAAHGPAVFRVVPGTWDVRPDGRRLDVAPFRSVDRLNRERAVTPEGWLAMVTGAAGEAGLPDGALEEPLRWIARPYARADLLAGHYQRLYNLGSSALFFGSALAVVLGALQVLLLRDQVWLVLAEALVMVALLALLVVARREELHGRWLGYRALAEACRSALFLALTHGDDSLAAPALKRSERWVPRAYEEIWIARPRGGPAVGLEPLRALVADGWVVDQLQYQARAAGRLEAHERRLSAGISALFAATLTAAALHFWLDWAHVEAGTNVVALFSISLPAVGAALGGLRAQRDYQRNANRARQSAVALTVLRDRLTAVTCDEDLRTVCRAVASHLAQENRGWYDDMVFHDVELHV